MSRRNKRIRSIVEILLEQTDNTTPPIDVKKVARKQNITIIEEDLGDISGLLFREGNEVTIGVNKNHHLSRKRFTVAHELGHFFLHSKYSLFVDKVFAVKLRDHVSSEAIDSDEIEANAFAAELIMPANLVFDDFIKAQSGILDYEDDNLDETISGLANKYQVSKQAMNIRLINMGVIPDLY